MQSVNQDIQYVYIKLAHMCKTLSIHCHKTITQISYTQTYYGHADQLCIVVLMYMHQGLACSEHFTLHALIWYSILYHSFAPWLTLISDLCKWNTSHPLCHTLHSLAAQLLSIVVAPPAWLYKSHFTLSLSC